MNHSIAIASIGSVNLLTAKNAMFGDMWDCWKEDAGSHDMLVQLDSGKMIITHTCGQGESVGYVSDYHHDQSGRRIGRGTVVAVEPHTKEGLRNLAARDGKKSLNMATYK